MPWKNLLSIKKELPSVGSGRLPEGSIKPSTGVFVEHNVWETTSDPAESRGPSVYIHSDKGDTTKKGLSREAPFQILVSINHGDLGIPGGKYTTCVYVQFEQLVEPSLQWLPIKTFQRRTTWKVGIASNLRNTTKPTTLSVGPYFTHWGVYILPQTATTHEYPYRIYGLNFSGKDGKKGRDDETALIVGQNWATDRGYMKDISASEFTRVTEPVEMHFAHDEFILTARYLLMKFHEKQDDYRHIKQMDAKAYSLVAKNCHTFAQQILQHMTADGWADPARLEDGRNSTWPEKLEHDVRARYADQELMKSIEAQPVKQRKKTLANLMKKEGPAFPQ